MENDDQLTIEQQIEFLTERMDLLNARMIGLNNSLMKIQPWVNNVNIFMEKTTSEIVGLTSKDKPLDFGGKLRARFSGKSEN